MTIDQRAFWTDIASGLVLAAILPFLPRIIGLIALAGSLGAVLLFVIDEAWGGSSLDQLAEIIAELIRSRTGGI